MDVETAVQLTNAIIFYPGWVISAEDLSHRFEGAICVEFQYPTRSSARGEAREGYPNEMVATARFAIMASECTDATDLYRKVFKGIQDIRCHEDREFFRIQPTGWAPFHPHRSGGMARWGDREADLRFGIV